MTRGTWKDNGSKTDERHLGKEDLKVGEGWRYLCPMLNAHQKVTSAEEEFNNQQIGWPVLWIVSLFPQRLLSFPNGLVRASDLRLCFSDLQKISGPWDFINHAPYLVFLPSKNLFKCEIRTLPSACREGLSWRPPPRVKSSQERPMPKDRRTIILLLKRQIKKVMK